MSIGSCRGKQQLKASVTHCRGTERERERKRERESCEFCVVDDIDFRFVFFRPLKFHDPHLSPGWD